jgi:tetratricopeptide (TPR) repeat protein
LVDKSLVVADFSRPAPYRLLESTREYTRERLARAGQLAGLTRRHADAMREAALRAHERWHTGNDDAALGPIVAAIDNVRAALDWMFSPSGDRRGGAALAAELLQVWVLIGGVAEGLGWVQRALEQQDAGVAPLDDETVARLHLAAGLLNLQLTRPAPAIECARRALAHFRASGDQHRVVEALDYLCRALRHAGRPDEAMRVVDEGTALARAQQMPRYSAQFVCWRASAETGLRRFGDARRHLDEAAASYRALGYSRGLRSVQYTLSHVEFGAGNYDRAIEVGGFAIDDRRSAGREGLWTLPQVLAYRAAAHIAIGALDAARADALEAMERARQMSETTILCVAIEQLALIGALHGNLPVAARLLGYSRATLPPGYERLYAEEVSYDRLVALLESLAPDERDRLAAEGTALGDDGLAAEALMV